MTYRNAYIRNDGDFDKGLITIEQAAARMGMSREAFIEWTQDKDIDQYHGRKVKWRQVKRIAESTK